MIETRSQTNPVFRVLELIFAPILLVLQFITHNICQSLFFNFFSRAKAWGELSVKLPDTSETQVFGQRGAENKIVLNVKNAKHFFWRCITQGDIGFSESYIAGEVEVSDLNMFFKMLIANRDHMNNIDTVTAAVGHLFDKIKHLRSSNTLEGSRKNIEQHYDLGNEMFKLFLDPTMTYSCAFWENPSQTLEEAQMNKIRKMLKRVNPQKEDHILEIGSGWGACAIEAVRMSGCKVTTITLSHQQKEYVDALVAKLGLSDRITCEIIDYRKIDPTTRTKIGYFDKIVSCEMLEAVGHEFLPVYFKRCAELLKPGGLMCFQVITTPNKNYEAYRRGCDFIQKHIFPGSLCPSINAVLDAVETADVLKVEETENIGAHYARTLREWRINFLNNRDKILKMGFDEFFIRKWEYYFCYCEAGFESRYLGDYQVVLKKHVL